MNRQIWIRGIILAVLVSATSPVRGQGGPAPTAKGVQDNSFLIEEAYNQEAEMVQHIFTFRRDVLSQAGSTDRNWYFSFTQEWPVLSQTHQFSYTVPVTRLAPGGSPAERGLGDMLLNYRFQALSETATQPAFAPRLSAVLPTGNEAKGLGENAWGVQLNLPVSKIVHDQWTLHGNAGLTRLSGVRGRNPVTCNFGGSGIFAATRDFNLMFEATGEWRESVNGSGRIEREFAGTFSPGFRYAFNLPSGQLVVGAAVPLPLTKAAPDRSVFLYLSFEHPLLKK
jgi:hypothetical protein